MLASFAHMPASGMFRISRMTLPTNMLAMVPQMTSGLVMNSVGPGVMPCIMNAPIKIAMVGEQGMPSVNSGIIAPPT